MELQESVQVESGSSPFLPNEILNKIFRLLDTKSLLTAVQVCQQWRAVSLLSLNRRITLRKATNSHSSHEESKLRRYCDDYFSIHILETEASAGPTALVNHQGDVGVLAGRGTCQRYYNEDPVFRHQVLYQAFLYLPKLDWAHQVTLLCLLYGLDLPGREVNKLVPCLLEKLKSLKCFEVFVGWNGDRVAARGAPRSPAPDRPPALNASMLKLKLVFEVEANEERRHAFGNVFLDVPGFVAICPNLQKLNVRCSVGPLEYKTKGKRLSSENWDINFAWKPSKRPLDDIHKDIKSIITGIPIKSLRVQGKKQLALVETMVGGSCTLQQLTLTSLYRDDCKASIPSVIQRWNTNSAFSCLTQLSIGIPDSEADFDGVAPMAPTTTPKGGYLSNVVKLQLLQHETHSVDLSLRPKMTKFSEAYWTNLLQWMPNVELLVTNWPISAFKSQAKMLPRLRHVVRCYTPVRNDDANLFESDELGSVLDSFEELQSYTLDVPWNRSNCNTEEGIQNLNQETLLGLKLIQKSSVKLIQLNTPNLPKEILDQLLKLKVANSKATTIRLFDIDHTHFFHYVRNVSLEACELAVVTSGNDMAPNVMPAQTLFV